MHGHRKPPRGCQYCILVLVVLVGAGWMASYRWHVRVSISAHRLSPISTAVIGDGGFSLVRASTDASDKALADLRAVKPQFGAWWPDDEGISVYQVGPSTLSGGTMYVSWYPSMQRSRQPSPCFPECICNAKPCRLSKASFQYTLIWIPYWCLFSLVATLGGYSYWRARRSAPGTCSMCAYDLAGAVSSRCPECGTPIQYR